MSLDLWGNGKVDGGEIKQKLLRNLESLETMAELQGEAVKRFETERQLHFSGGYIRKQLESQRQPHDECGQELLRNNRAATAMNLSKFDQEKITKLLGFEMKILTRLIYELSDRKSVQMNIDDERISSESILKKVTLLRNNQEGNAKQSKGFFQGICSFLRRIFCCKTTSSTGDSKEPSLFTRIPPVWHISKPPFVSLQNIGNSCYMYLSTYLAILL